MKMHERHRAGQPDHRGSSTSGSCRASPAQAPPAGRRCLFPGSRPVIERVIIGLPSDDIIDDYTTGARRRPAHPEPALPRRGELRRGRECPLRGRVAAVHARAARLRRANSSRQGKFFGYWTINDPVTMTPSSRPAGRTGSSPTTWGRSTCVGIAGVLPRIPWASPRESPPPRLRARRGHHRPGGGAPGRSRAGRALGLGARCLRGLRAAGLPLARHRGVHLVERWPCRRAERRLPGSALHAPLPRHLLDPDPLERDEHLPAGDERTRDGRATRPPRSASPSVRAGTSTGSGCARGSGSTACR